MYNILIIDNEYNSIVNQFLEIGKYNYEFIINHIDLKETIVKKNIDMILCRVDLKKYDGFYIIQLVYSIFKKKIPFILYKENCNYSEFRRGMELGADDVISFPIETIMIENTINKIFNKINTLSKITV